VAAYCCGLLGALGGLDPPGPELGLDPKFPKPDPELPLEPELLNPKLLEPLDPFDPFEPLIPVPAALPFAPAPFMFPPLAIPPPFIKSSSCGS
jgi:hypothetical protein